MRKIIFVAVFLIMGVQAFSQLKFKAGLIPGPTSTSVDIVIRPDVNFTGYLTNVIFIFQIPNSVTQPTITKTSLTSYFPSYSDLTTLPNQAGYTTYGFSAVNASVTTTTNINAGVDYPIMRLSFSGGPSTATSVRIAHLASGGPGTLYQNYVEANASVPALGAGDYTDYVQMFFGSSVVPAVPHPDEVTGYASYQYSQVSQILPLKWLSFNAIKQNNDALINWSVSDEDRNNHYELQRSLNGNDFTTIATINKNGSGSGVHDYAYTDQNITTLGSPVIYYRLKQVDIDTRYTFSEIRKVNINLKTNAITIYPNPVTDGFYVVIPTVHRAAEKNISLVLTSSSGQIIQTKHISSLQAANYYFDVKGLSLAGGNYFLQIFHQGVLLERKQLFVSKE